MKGAFSSAESFSQQWTSTTALLSGSLERNDKLRVSLIKSFDDVHELIPTILPSSLAMTTPHEVLPLANSLEKLKDFMDFVSTEATPHTDNSIFWGLVGLVVQLSQSEESTAPRVPHMISSVCQNIDVLNKHRSKTPKQLPEIQNTCFHIANSLFSFLVATIGFMGEDVEIFANDSNVWESLEQQFKTFISQIDRAVCRLDKLSRLSQTDDLGHGRSSLTRPNQSPDSRSEDLATLPCFIYPPSRTLRLFNNTEDIIEIDRFFNQGAPAFGQSFRTLTLYGVGGIGKSSVALRYAETKIHQKELDAMFWIAGEKNVTIRQSFSDIAVRLNLPGAQPKDHDQNKTLVLDWLQTTMCRWLLIFDNIESVDLLMTYWPTASRGQAVITTRNHDFAFYPTVGGLEMTEWDTETGSRFLAHLLSTNIGEQLTQEGAESGHVPSQDLSGHALALSLMAGLINHRSWSIGEFLEFYKRQPQNLCGIFGTSSINALWDMTFRSLNENARAILGVLAFLSPDNIPQALFEPKDLQNLPESLAFCRDSIHFLDEMQSLATLALVKHSKDDRVFSIHRLIQKAFKHFMSSEERQKSFNDATMLVSAVFPRKDAEFAQLYHSWKLCSLHLPHVLSLRDFFREERGVDPKFSVLVLYCDLNNACQRYLIETNGYNELLDLSEINSIAMSTIPPQPHRTQVELRGSLASHRGQVLARLGRAVEGVRELKFAYELFTTDEPRNLREEAWCAENLADGLASMNNFTDAVKFQEMARDHWLEWAKDNSKDKTEWPAILKWGMGTNLIWAGYNRRARDVLTQALVQLEAAEPYSWAMVAYTNYSLGTVNRAEGNFEPAERHFTEAYNKWISGDNLASDPFCGACVYRMGCAALDQGKVQLATKLLREASATTERHKVKMPVEHARSLFKLSEALASEPREQEASKRLRKESKHLLLSRSPDAKNFDHEKTYDDLIFIWWR